VEGRGSVPPQRVNDSSAVFAEMAVPGTAFSGEWNLRAALQSKEMQRARGWRSLPELNTILEGCNAYAAAQLELHEAYAQTLGLSALSQTIARLQEQLATIRNSGSGCLLCLGWGSGFLSKVAYLDTAQPAYRTLLRAVPAIGKSLREGVVFPKTRRVVFLSGQPAAIPGWVRAEFAD
jgi:CRISPR-associated protein Csm5